MTVSEKLQLALYELAEFIVLKSKSHVLSESITLPTCKKCLHLCFVIKLMKKVAKFHFQTIQFKEELSTCPDIESVIVRLQKNLFTLRINELTEKYGLLWDSHVGICTDRAPSIVS